MMHEVPWMDFLNQALAQLKGRFRSTAPGTRVAAGLLLFVVIVGAGYLVTFQGSGDEVYLFEGAKILPEDLPKMQTAFAQKKLNSYMIDGNRIRVPRRELDQYVSALDEANAQPWRPGMYVEKALKQTTFLDSNRITELRELNAKQRDLARILATWEFIADAAVIIDKESQRGFPREKIVTASVSVTPAGSKRLDADQVAGIRKWMAGAVAGLKPENVQVSDGSGSVDRDDPAASRRLYEGELEAKILDALSYIPGVVVTTHVVLDQENGSNAGPIDRPPVAAEYDTGSANVSQRLARQPYGRGQRKTDQACRGASGGPSSKTAETDMAGCTPARISVSVAVPNSFFVKVWRNRNPAANVTLEKVRTEETAKIRSQVANLLPPVEGLSDPTWLVNVATFPDFPPEKAAGTRAVAWMGKYKVMLGIVGVALLGLLVSWPVVRARHAARKADAGPTILPMETGKDEETAAADHRERGHGLTVHDELHRFVREDPAAAAGVLRTWLRNAG